MVWLRKPWNGLLFWNFFQLFLWKKKVQTVTPVAVPVDGNESDIGDGSDKSDGSIESKTEEEVIEGETKEDIEESYSSESEEDETRGSATNGRKLNAKAKDKKVNLSWWKGKWILPKESSFVEVPLRMNETGNFSSNTSLIQFFELFCNDEIFQLTVDQSNLYNTQRSTEGYEVAVMSNRKRPRSYKKVAAVTAGEMKHF